MRALVAAVQKLLLIPFLLIQCSVLKTVKAVDMTMGLCGTASEFWGAQDNMGLYLAMHYWNDGPESLAGGLPKPANATRFNVSVVELDSGCSSSTSFNSAMNVFNSVAVDAINGCLCSAGSIQVGRFSTALQIPMMATASQSSLLSNKADYPYLFRWCTTEITDADMHASVLVAMDIQKYTIVYIDFQKNVLAKDSLLANPGVQDKEALVVRIPDVDMRVPENYAVAVSALMEARMSSAWVLVMYVTTDVTESNKIAITNAGFEVGLFNNYSIVLLEEVMSVPLNGERAGVILDEFVRAHLVGSIVGRAKAVESRVQAWRDWMTTVSLNSLRELGFDSPFAVQDWLTNAHMQAESWHAFRFDATIALLMVLQDIKLLGQNLTSAAIMEGILNLPLKGIMGDVSWDANLNRQGLVYEVLQLQYQDDTATWPASLVQVGETVLTPDENGLVSATLNMSLLRFQTSGPGTLPRRELIYPEAPPCPDGWTKPDAFAPPAECSPCPQGTFNSDAIGNACIPCQSGLYGSEEAATRCQSCSPGSFSNTSGSTKCFPCDKGTAALSGATTCIECEPGMYSSIEGKSLCDACPLGTHTSLTGVTACMPCSAGTYADEPGYTACEECAAGHYKPNSSAPHQCFPCVRGRFTSDQGSTACEMCPLGTTEILGATSSDYCICPQSTFLFLTSDGERQCLNCNSYMLPCLGGDHPAEQQAGYYISTDGEKVHRCASKEACPQGPLGTCSAGSSGPGCGQCEVGEYVWNGDRCQRCGATDIVYALLVPVVLAFALWVIYRYGNEPTSRKLSTTSEFIVLAGLSANVFFYLNAAEGFDVAWEEPLGGLLQVVAGVSAELVGVNLSCSMSFSNVMNFVISSIVPAVVLVIFILLGVLKIAVPKKLFNTFATCTYALYLLLVLHALKPFRYIVHPYGGKSMQDLPDVFEGSSEHTGLVLVGICVIVFYCAPFAALCLLATVSVRRSQTTAQRRWWLTNFRFLLYKFRPEVYYWGVYILVRNAFFALAPSIAPEMPRLGVFILTFITSASMAHTALVHPWRQFWMTIVDVSILAYVLLVLNLAAGWTRDDDADAFLASGLVSLGGLACACAGYLLLRLLLGRMCASKEALEKMREDSAEIDKMYLIHLSALFVDPQVEVSDAFEQLTLEKTISLVSGSSLQNLGTLPWPLSLIQKEQTTLLIIAGIAKSMRDPDYNLQHYYEDCMYAFPELQLYNQDVMRQKASKSKSLPGVSNSLNSSTFAVGGHTLAEEQQRTIGALFAVYCLCRLDLNGKKVMAFGVDEDRPHVVKDVSPGLSQDDLKATGWGKMDPPQRRANFYWNFDWQLMETLLLEAGILLRNTDQSLAVDEERMVAMLSLTAYHDIMKDQALCPSVVGVDYEGLKAGETIRDHDMALAYLLDRHPDVLPSFRILSPEQQRLVRFTQSDMGFNAGWLVQAEGPPSGVLHKLKNTIARGGVRDKDVAFYFVHWVTDLAGAEPTPFTGSEKFAAKFPPTVLQGLLGCFSVVRMLADHTETEVYEAYLTQTWQSAQVKKNTVRDLPQGREAIARMRLLCMAQAGADAVLDEFDRLADTDREILVQELSETGLPDQQYSSWLGTNGPGAGTPFLLYYGPAWCQRVGQQQPRLALRVLAAVLKYARDEYPESRDKYRDLKEGILCRTIEVGLLKTIKTEYLERSYGADVVETEFPPLLAVDRSSNLEGTLQEVFEAFEC